MKPQTDSEVVEIEEIQKVKTEPGGSGGEQQMVASYEEEEYQDYQEQGYEGEPEEYSQDQSGAYEGGAHPVVDFDKHGAQGKYMGKRKFWHT